MKVPEELLYSKEHEWIKLEEGESVVGITDYAQDQLGDVVFVELPEVGDQFELDDSLASLESVKAVSEVYSPLSGEIVAVNERLTEAPELINEDPYGSGWIVRLRMNDLGQVDDLLSAADYTDYVEEEGD